MAGRDANKRRYRWMLIYLDESGDPGTKVGRGSSERFVLTMVLFEDHEEASACDSTIEWLKSKLLPSRKSEFHFNKCSQEIRMKFLAGISDHMFFYRSMVIEKSRLSGPEIHLKGDFYRYACGLLFWNARPYLRDAIIVIDGGSDREFQQQLQTYLKAHCNVGEVRLIRKIKIQDSSRNNLLQLADMIVARLLVPISWTKPTIRSTAASLATWRRRFRYGRQNKSRRPIPCGHAHHTVTVRSSGRFQ